MGIFKKIFNSILILYGVVILIFILFQAFGDPASLIVGQSGDKKTIENIKRELHLDQPKWKQLLYYINEISPISFYDNASFIPDRYNGIFIGNKLKIGLKLPYLGKSYQLKKSVTSILKEAIPGTLVLTLCALTFAGFLGIGLGIIAAIYKNTWVDKITFFSTVIGISAPSFFIGLIIAYFFGIVLHQYTGLNFSGSLYEIDDSTGRAYLQLKNLILPAMALGIRPLAIITQITRSSMLEVMSQPFITTAISKGTKKYKIILFHALPNTLNPIVTTISSWLAELLAGSFFIEYIFGWKGLGKVTISALDKLDYPVVMGAVLYCACFFILINFLTDFLLQKIDPRIR